MYRTFKIIIQSSCWRCADFSKMVISYSGASHLTTLGEFRVFSNNVDKLLVRSLMSISAIPKITHSSLQPAQHNSIFSSPLSITTFQNNRFISSSSNSQHPNTSQFTNANRTTLKYIVAIATFVVGLSYAAVPLYRVFCQASGYGGTVTLAEANEKVENMEPIRERELTIRFNADTSAAMLWHFKPHQSEIKLVPGETALAFYTARNPTDEPVTGIATYNVIPFEAGIYFNKIQCFCFEEQRLNPHEQVDMPVFFYIDPEFNDDPAMAKVDSITLSYTFFEAKEEENIYSSLPAAT